MNKKKRVSGSEITRLLKDNEPDFLATLVTIKNTFTSRKIISVTYKEKEYRP